MIVVTLNHQEDIAAIMDSLSGEYDPYKTLEVTLIKDIGHTWTVGRWESFGWKVRNK